MGEISSKYSTHKSLLSHYPIKIALLIDCLRLFFLISETTFWLILMRISPYHNMQQNAAIIFLFQRRPSGAISRFTLPLSSQLRGRNLQSGQYK